MAKVFTVGQLNTNIKRLLAQDPMLGLVYVKGEISNLTYHKTGHIYFTLKDENAAISAMMFASNKVHLNFRLQEGMEVIVEGKVDYYEPQGKCSLIASRIKQEGVGNLSEQFEALKKKLLEMGMFDKTYKKPIPKFAKTIGVVTAPTGAAVRDIINVSKRRNPGIKIVVYPALVQGEGAPASIIRGIEKLDAYGVDVMIVGRGGGSMEDLFCFNDETLAHAIFDCQTPIISAVGHETDFTIADFVSDLRAPTPSAAAELAVTDMSALINKMNTYNNLINSLFKRVLADRKSRLQHRTLKLQSLSPKQKLLDNRKRLETLKNKLDDKIDKLISDKRHLFKLYDEKLENKIDKKISSKKHSFNIYVEKLKGLSPLDKLSQGYSFVADNNGKTVNSIEKINVGDDVNIFVTDGEITATVKEKKHIDRV